MTEQFPGIMSFFSSLDESITISPYIILGIAGLFALVGIILGLLFEYHWKTYGVDKIEILRVRFWYYAGSIVFGGAMIVSAILYVLSA